MKKLKTISPFKLGVLILFVSALIYTLFSLNSWPKSIYKEGSGAIEGRITNCQKTDYGNKLTVKSQEKIIVNYYKAFSCKLGQKIVATGEFKLPKSRVVFNLFDYRKYLLSQKINYTFTAREIKITDKTVPKIYKIKNTIIKKIESYKSEDYLKAFILGDNKSVDKEVMNSYRTNGISHLLAISGMHITLLSMIILGFLNKIIKNKKASYFLVIIVLIFYAFLTNFTPSVIRATLLFIALSINKIFKLKIKTIYFLILISSIYLLYNPYMVYHIGFLFSFIITFYLVIFKDTIINCKNYISKTFMISLIAFLASIPILINNFFSANLLSPLINVLFVPLVSLIIYPLSLCTLIFKPLDFIFYDLVSFMENISLLVSKITIFDLTLKHVNIVVIIIYYFIITYTIYKLNKKKIGIFILIILLHHQINYLDKYPMITMIDVGQGDSILIKLPHKTGNILIDTGGLINLKQKTPYDSAQSTIIPYLKSEGVDKIDYLILTHGDFDHAGMAPNLINNFKIKKIILNSQNDNSLEKTIIKSANKKNINYEKVNKKSMKIGQYTFEFLASQTSSSENDDSLIIYTKLKAQNILLMGDASEEREKCILNTYKLPKMDILKVGHHGSKTSSSPELIKQIKPKISLISAGKNNLYGHPHKETLERLENSKILITQIDGSVKLELKNRIIYTTAR